MIDMDGVLYDSMKYHTLAWKQMMDERGIPCRRDEFYLYEGMTGPATIDLIFMRHFGRPCDPEEAKRLYARKSEIFVGYGRKETMEGAADMLRTLKEHGVKCVLVTGSAQSSLLNSLDSDYPGVFTKEDRVTAHDVKHGKPDPEPYLKGLAKAGTRPEETIVIENAPLGVRAGVAAGIATIAVTTGPIPRTSFEEEHADMIFSSMPEFAAALPGILESGKPLRTLHLKERKQNGNQ